MKTMLENAVAGILPTDEEALALADYTDTRALADAASQMRDQGFNNVVTYSRKVFIPLTHLCRDVCHYCTFAQVPRKVQAPYLSIDEVLELARHGQRMGCKEALFTLGEKPELRYKAARDALAEMGYASTTDYLFAAAKAVFEETGLLPHL
ncbi:MAG: radical SAM protein, partial [Pseudomonadota bacterium]|nr:radical SAM protein [Pseudomonadota bacterium]